MNAADFDGQFNRLAAHFHLPTDSSRDEIALDWFKALEHYHVDALERGVTHLIKTSTDRFWPALGKLSQAIRDKMHGLELVHSKCLTCRGSGWIDSAPFWSNGMVYDGVNVRCPDCGKPQPVYQEPNGRRALTATEYQAWRSGTLTRDYMPEGLKAKHPDRTANPELRQAMERLREKMFGKLETAKVTARQSIKSAEETA